MTHWAEKIVSNTEWALVRDAFEKQFEALGSPRDMMLIAVEGQADATRLIIGLPDDISLSPYDGFVVFLVQRVFKPDIKIASRNCSSIRTLKPPTSPTSYRRRSF